MKTKNELDAPKEEAQKMKNKPEALTDDMLAEVTGGAKGVPIGAKKWVCPLCSKIYFSGSYCKEKACNKAALVEDKSW